MFAELKISGYLKINFKINTQRGGQGGRRGFRMGNTCIPVADSC